MTDAYSKKYVRAPESNVIAMKGETQETNTMGDKAMTTMKKPGAPILE